MKHILTLAALVFVTCCFGQESCSNDIDINGNGTVDITDFLNVLGLFGDVDSDGDGVSDGFDTCQETPEGEEVDNNGCGLETQQEDDGGDVTVKHHPLDYWVDHTTGTIILDKQLRQRVWWGDTDWNVELAMEDIKILISEEE